MAINIQLRRGTASEWSGSNPTLAVAELGLETDTGQFKIGDGSVAWNSLAYGGIQGPPGVSTATAPLAYDAGSQTVSIDLTAYDTSSEVDGKLASYDTSSEVDSKISALVDSSPSTLDTLNELAAALGDDANFATTVTDSIATKAPLTQPVSAKTGAYSLVVGDRGAVITCDGTFAVTIPSATFAAGDRVDVVNVGTGVITFTGSGVTVNSADAAVTIDTQYASASFVFTSSSAGVLIGKLA
jgi:hypothetical protein